jgi:hypothetical protein
MNFRAISKRKSSEYSLPALGLIFLVTRPGAQNLQQLVAHMARRRLPANTRTGRASILGIRMNSATTVAENIGGESTHA